MYRYPWAVKNRAAAGPDGHGANGSKPFGLTAFGEGAVHLLCLRDETLYPLTFLHMTLRNKSREIAALNDLARQTFMFCRVVLSQGLMTLEDHDLQEVVTKVRRFDTFTSDSDPYGEHDFGMIEHQGQKYFWKFDYYDQNMQFGSPDPSDTEQTTRVLTVFLADEY